MKNHCTTPQNPFSGKPGGALLGAQGFCGRERRAMDSPHGMDAMDAHYLFVHVCGNGSSDQVAELRKEYADAIAFHDDSTVATTALLRACSYGNIGVVRYLRREFGLGLQHIRKNENAAFRMACHKGHIDIVRMLVDEVGLELHDMRSNGNEGLHEAMNHGHLDVVEYLTSRVPGLTYDDVVGADGSAVQPTLLKCCERGHLELAQYVITKFRPTSADVHALMLFTISCVRGHMELSRWLSSTFDFTKEEVANSGALDWALFNKHMEVAEWISNEFGLDFPYAVMTKRAL